MDLLYHGFPILAQQGHLLGDVPLLLVRLDRCSGSDSLPYALDILQPLLGSPENLVTALHGFCMLNELCMGVS